MHRGYRATPQCPFCVMMMMMMVDAVERRQIRTKTRMERMKMEFIQYTHKNAITKCVSCAVAGEEGILYCVRGQMSAWRCILARYSRIHRTYDIEMKMHPSSHLMGLVWVFSSLTLFPSTSRIHSVRLLLLDITTSASPLERNHKCLLLMKLPSLLACLGYLFNLPQLIFTYRI